MKKIPVLISLILILFMGVNLYAANQVVTNNNDSGAGSLRQALSDVGDGEGITFNLTEGNETITVATELVPSASNTITINGDNTAGSGTDVTVQVTTPGTTDCRVFQSRPNEGKTHTISNMTIKGGNITGFGGSISYSSCSGDLVLSNCTITGSKSTSDAAGVYAYLGNDVTISDCTFSSCQSSRNGGGLFIRGSNSVSIDDCTFDSNSSTELGAGAYVYEDDCTILDSTFSDNSATYSGGGLYVAEGETTMTNCTLNGNSSAGGTGNQFGGGVMFAWGDHIMTNCTVFDNSAEFGGGISCPGSGSTLILTNVTVANNSCSNTADGVYQTWGATYIKNCLFANNDDQDFVMGGIAPTDNGYNIVETSVDHTWVGTGDITGNQASLYLSSSLADNDTLNQTQTLALTNVSSVARNAGDPANAANNGVSIPSTDQRGLERNGRTDIGAYEYAGGEAEVNALFFGSNF